jgi:hypothetical protein
MKREQLIRELRKLAKKEGVAFEVFEDSGKGSHYGVQYGDRITTIKSGEMTPLYVQIIKKQLGIK